jgi:hypothetical protein
MKADQGSHTSELVARRTGNGSFCEHAQSMLRHVHWWLFAVTVLLTTAVYFDPLTVRYLCFSVAMGVIWCGLTMATWRIRSNILSIITFVTIFLPHYHYRIGGPAMSGILASGATMFWLLLLGRRYVYRFCKLPLPGEVPIPTNSGGNPECQ